MLQKIKSYDFTGEKKYYNDLADSFESIPGIYLLQP